MPVTFHIGLAKMGVGQEVGLLLKLIGYLFNYMWGCIGHDLPARLLALLIPPSCYAFIQKF